MPAYEKFASDSAHYAKEFKHGDLALPPAEKLIIVTCMDARIEPLSQLQKNLGDAHVIRNAGGLASTEEGLRSIIISQRLLGTREIAIFRHTDCGMLLFTSDDVRNIVKGADPSVASAVNAIDFLEFSDLEESIRKDIRFLKDSKLIIPETTITGWIYDVKTGLVRKVDA